MTGPDDLPARDERGAAAEAARANGVVPPSGAQKAWIWVIGGYLVRNAGAGLVSLFLLAGRALPIAADTVALINSLPPLLFFAAFAHAFLSLAGGVFLLMRKRIALPFLAGGVVAKIASEAVTARPADLPITPALYAATVIAEIVILAAILAFVARLWRLRVLEP